MIPTKINEYRTTIDPSHIRIQVSTDYQPFTSECEGCEGKKSMDLKSLRFDYTTIARTYTALAGENLSSILRQYHRHNVIKSSVEHECFILSFSI